MEENMTQRRRGETSAYKLLQLTPEELRKQDPSRFDYMRTADLEKFSDEQILALRPEQIKAMIPLTFSNLDVDLLRQLLQRLEKEVPFEPDVYTETIQGREVERLGAKETIRRAIPKAIQRAEQKEQYEYLRKQDGRVDDANILASVVAAKLDITLRFMYNLSVAKEIKMFRVAGKVMCDYQSVIDYLNRRRVPGAKFASGKIVYDENGKYVPAELEPITEIPLLYSTRHFGDKMNMSFRSFTYNCNLGYYDHFRIGDIIKLSEEDFERSLQRIKDSY